MGTAWDTERGVKAAAWVAFYGVLWLLMQLSCELGLPATCRRGTEPVDVLIELPFLVAFALGQAFLCDILDPERYAGLVKRWYFPVIVIGSGLIASALMEDDGFMDIQESEGDRTSGVDVASILLVITVGLAILYHMYLACKLLPGAVLISGGVSPPGDETGPVRMGNRFAQYLAIALLTTVYAAVYAAYAHERGDGWNFHYVLLSWVLSLISTFDESLSIIWLGMTTGAFIQGVGSQSFQFMFRSG